jgi:hypothetical protein
MQKGISLPFEVVAATVHWEKASAHIKGWYRRADGDLLSEYLLAEVTTSNGNVKSIPYPIAWIPENESRYCIPTLFEDGSYVRIEDVEVEQICSAFEPELLFFDGTNAIGGKGPKGQPQPPDAWDMREEFLQLKVGWKEVIAFLNKWGRWDSREYAYLSDIEQLQRVLFDALVSPPELWFATGDSVPPPIWYRRPKPPYFTIRTDRCQLALRMTVTIDLLNQTKFKRCARPDCGMLFKVQTNHKRDYCLAYCSHLESVRRKRKAAKQSG